MFKELDLTKVSGGADSDSEAEHWIRQMPRKDLIRLHERIFGTAPKSRQKKQSIIASIAQKTLWFLSFRRDEDLAKAAETVVQNQWQALGLTCYHDELDWTRLNSVRIMPLDEKVNWGLVNVGARMVCVICDDRGQPLVNTPDFEARQAFLQKWAREKKSAQAQDLLVGDVDRVADDVRRGRLSADQARCMASDALQAGLSRLKHERLLRLLDDLTQEDIAR